MVSSPLRWTLLRNYRTSASEQHSYSPLNPRERGGASWRAVAAAAVIALGALAGWLAPGVAPRPGEDVLVELPVRDVQGSLAVKVWNEYVTAGREVELYPWEHIAEPHKMTVMHVASWPDDKLRDDVRFRWTVNGDVRGTGASLKTAFGSPGQYECTVAAFYPGRPAAGTTEREGSVSSGNPGALSDETVATTEEEGEGEGEADDVRLRHTFVVTVKYVRREIRSLTDRDRETFFNAVSVLQRVPSAVGRQIYGDKYYSKDYFNRLHLYYGGRKDCDHWHDGPGFVTSHIAVSLMFEQALQAVNPAISLPYWDFTVEGTAYDWTNFRTSSVFSDDWFGSAAPRNELMTPDRGRFAFVPAMTNAREYSELTNSFGLLRAPWNSDPNPFLTRHDRVFQYENNRKPAGCKQYRDAVQKNSWMSLTSAMNAGAHGHIHELLGGTWSSDWRNYMDRTDEVVFPFMHAVVPLMKYLWRVGYLECPDSCGTSLSWEECQCTCQEGDKRPSEVLEEAGLLSKSVGAFFYDRNWNLIETLGDSEGHAKLQLPGYTEEETADIYSELLHTLCTPMKVGSHYEGTSTNDMTFWVLHPTFDRLWHLSRLDNVDDFDESWANDHSCGGHNPGDIQPFHSLFVGDANRESAEGVAVPKAYYTNKQLYMHFKPDGMAIPYVYDHFKWTHCDEIGIYMRRKEE